MPPEALGQLVQVGAVGAITAFILTRIEPRLKDLADAVDRTGRALLLLTLAINNISPRTKAEAERLLAETDAAQGKRK